MSREFIREELSFMLSIKCTISGSFQRFLPEILIKVKECKEQNINVLSPQATEANGEYNGFIFLRNDKGTPKDIEINHLTAIRNSDFLYVVNPNGYIGSSVTLEIGFAIAHAIPIFCLESPKEYILSQFINEVQPSIQRIVEQSFIQVLPEIPKGSDLSSLQNYIRKMIRLRNFEEESILDAVLLLVEEVGELAKAVRHKVGLMTDLSNVNNDHSISNELADCLIYILDIANLAGINLEEALREKEKINARKKWKKHKYYRAKTT